MGPCRREVQNHPNALGLAKQQLEWDVMQQIDSHEICKVLRINVEDQARDVVFDTNDVAPAVATSSDAGTNASMIVPNCAPKTTTVATSSTATTTAMCSKPILARHHQPHPIVTQIRSQGISASSSKSSSSAETPLLPLGPISSDDSQDSIPQEWWKNVERSLDDVLGVALAVYHNKLTLENQLLGQNCWYDYNSCPGCRKNPAHLSALGVKDGDDHYVHQRNEQNVDIFEGCDESDAEWS